MATLYFTDESKNWHEFMFLLFSVLNLRFYRQKSLNEKKMLVHALAVWQPSPSSSTL